MNDPRLTPFFSHTCISSFPALSAVGPPSVRVAQVLLMSGTSPYLCGLERLRLLSLLYWVPMVGQQQAVGGSLGPTQRGCPFSAVTAGPDSGSSCPISEIPWIRNASSQLCSQITGQNSPHSVPRRGVPPTQPLVACPGQGSEGNRMVLSWKSEGRDSKLSWTAGRGQGETENMPPPPYSSAASGKLGLWC